MAFSIFELGVTIDVVMSSVCLVIVIAITITFEGILHSLEHWIEEKASDITREVYMQVIKA